MVIVGCCRRGPKWTSAAGHGRLCVWFIVLICFICQLCPRSFLFFFFSSFCVSSFVIINDDIFLQSADWERKKKEFALALSSKVADWLLLLRLLLPNYTFCWPSSIIILMKSICCEVVVVVVVFVLTTSQLWLTFMFSFGGCLFALSSIISFLEHCCCCFCSVSSFLLISKLILRYFSSSTLSSLRKEREKEA